VPFKSETVSRQEGSNNNGNTKHLLVVRWWFIIDIH